MATAFTRRDFLRGGASLASAGAFSASAGCLGPFAPGAGKDDGFAASQAFNRSPERRDAMIDAWDRETERVDSPDYFAYMKDGDVRGFRALQASEYAFDKVLREVKSTVVTGETPAVWSVYNMGYVVKTRQSTFSVDLKHRRDLEMVPLLDFALVTHNHGDHFRREFCKAMDAAGKPLVSHFIENAAFAKIKAETDASARPGVYRVREVDIRPFRVDHAPAAWGIDFTSAFEMRIGDFRLLHTGDCGVANEKLRVEWGRPDLWLFFPMSSIDKAEAMRKIAPRRCVAGHLWELGHRNARRGGRLDAPKLKKYFSAMESACANCAVAFWGDRIS